MGVTSLGNSPLLCKNEGTNIHIYPPLNEPSEILGGKRGQSHCISVHPFSDVKVAALIFLSEIAISCRNPLGAQRWDSQKKLLLSGSGYC